MFGLGVNKLGVQSKKAFSITKLFSNAEEGFWYDPSDLTTLFQEETGFSFTTWDSSADTYTDGTGLSLVTVTASGQAVTLVRDKSGNELNAQQLVVADQPLYVTDGTLNWLEKDTVDSSLLVTLPDLGTDATISYANNAGVTILTGQTVGAGDFEVLRGENLFAIIVIDRALTDSETNNVYNYLNSKRGDYGFSYAEWSSAADTYGSLYA